MPNSSFEPETMLDELEKLDNVAYTKYNSAHLTPHCLVYLFEGIHDKDYYDSRIQNTCGDYVEIVCGNSLWE